LTNIGYLFSHGIGGNYVPLTWLSHALDWQLWGDDAWGHAAMNVAWHGVCCLLLIACLQRGGLGPTAACVAGALFAVHPVHTEPVAWISGRKDLLCGAALLACQYCYMGWRQRALRSSWRRSLFWLIVAGLTKPAAMSAIVCLALYDVVWQRRSAKETAKSLWPHALICVALAAIAVPAQQAASAIPEIADDRRWGALDQVGTNLLYQLLRCWVPVPFAPYYPGTFLRELPDWVRWSATLLLIGASVRLVFGWVHFRNSEGANRSIRTQWHDAAVWWWFGALGFLLPVSGIVPLGTASLADRYVYLPSIGPCIFIAIGAAALARRLPVAAYGSLCAAIVALGVLTHTQATAWHDSISLWRRTLAIFPQSAVAWISLTSALYHDRQPSEALEAATEGLRSNPGDLGLAGNAVSALADAGRFDEAEAALRIVEGAHPQAPEIPFLRGKLALLRRDDQSAREEFQTAINLRPDRSVAYLYLSLVLERLNDLPAASDAARQAVRLSLRDSKTRRRLIALLRKEGQRSEALREAEELTRRCPHDSEGWDTLISLLKESGRLAEVQLTAQKAVRYVPAASLSGN
jgi:Flp pilus assembly protein TadD